MRSGATEFLFAGVNSSAYDMVNLSPSSIGGLSTDSFIGSRAIREDKVEGRPSPYFYSVEELPMQFTVKFGFLGEIEITDDDIQDIEDWLIQDVYQPLVFSDDPDKYYWVIFNGISSFVHNGVNSGYFTLTARCLYPYPVTAETQTPDHIIVTSDSLIVENIGRKSIIPDINITIAGAGNKVINIKNNDNNTITEVTGEYGDVIHVDGFNKIITNITQDVQVKPSVRWMQLDAGNNDILITGDCTVNFRFRSGLYS